MTATVTALAWTPVKGLRVSGATRLQLGAAGAPDDRRFQIVERRGRMFNGKRTGALNTVVATYAHDTGELTLTFAGGESVSATVALGEPIDTTFYSQPVRARVVRGPWSDALSELVGQPLRLVEAIDRPGIDRGRRGAVSLVSRASLAAFARAAGTDDARARRFRMLVEIDGVCEHAEDGWIGARVRVGAALVGLRGNIGRCSVTTRHPETGEVDLPTLDVLRSYRGELDTTEPLAFGVYGEVLEGGLVAVGDAVSIEV